MRHRYRIDVKFKITLAFSLIFIMLCAIFGLIGYHQVHGMMIRVAVSHDALEANLRSLRQLIFTVCVVSVLVSGLAAYVVASLLLVPLQRIIHAARNFATNKTHDPIPVDGTRDELHELSVTINEMISRIDEAVQQQQNFFASASHELKTPLAILRTELEVGLRKPGLEEGLRQLLSNQLEEISRLQAIVNEFLVVSQLRVGAPSIYKKPFDLSVLIVKIFNQLLPLLRQKNIEPVIHFDEEVADFIVLADEDKIRIVLLNLLENAAKYGVKETAIICKVEKGGPGGVEGGAGTVQGAPGGVQGSPGGVGGGPGVVDGLRVRFVNTTKEERVETDNLQVAFYRSDLVQKGAGLGLWLCNEIIRLHNGRIEVTSGHHRFAVTVSIVTGVPIVSGSP